MNVTVVEGDLLDQEADVIVNAWNRNIVPWWLLLPHGTKHSDKTITPRTQVGGAEVIELPLVRLQH